MKSIAYRAVGYLSQGWAKGLAVVLIASLFIWFSGPSIALNDQRLLAPASNRLLLICLLLLIWGLWTAFSLWRKHQESQASNDDPEAAERAERQARIAEEQVELHARSKEAKRTLRSNRLYPGRSDRWRRELPWYLLLGPEGSGKSSLLMHSGLEFPLNPNEGNLASTRYADWYFAEHAVLVDTSGRYLTQTDNQLDGLGWQTLLKLLRRRRPRALNGVLVNIPVDLLQHDSEQAMENLARQTRQRLADIHQKLGVEVPVYLVLSKVDKVPGFEAFFDALSSDERDQVFGHSFSQDQDGTQADTVQLVFAELLKRLHNQVISRLHQERDVQRRGRILDFPQQLGQLGDRLALFIELAFSGNRYQRASRLRGFYLTSAPHQSSDMSDYAGVTAIDSRSSEHNRPWFIHDLMSRVIFPESNLASLDQNEIKRIHRRQRWMLATATASLLIMGVSWALSFSSNHQQLEQVRDYQQQARQDAAGLLPSAEAGDLIETLDARYAATQVFNDSKQAAWHQRLGLHQGDRVNPQLHTDYQLALQKLLLPRVAEQLENRVHAYQHDREQLLANLRAYLMLDMPERRDDDFLQSLLAEDWSRLYPGEADLQTGLSKHFAALLDTRFDSYPLDQPLVQQSRAVLRSESLASVVYRMLREQSENLPDYRLINRLGPQATLLASSQHAIPGLYTQNGYQRLFVAQGNELLQDLLDDNWVLGDSERMSTRDLNRLMQEVERLYFADYANHWADAIALLNVDPMSDITQGATQVAGFGGASSPLLLLLQEVLDNTRFLPAEELSTPLDQPLATNGRSEVNRALERRFEPLHRLLDDQGLAGPELTHALQALDALQVQLAALAHANHPEQSAYQLARQRMQGQQDALQQVRVSASRLPDPVKSWLTRLADDSWALVLADAHRYINQRYRSELYSNYRSALESRYPFQVDSESDVALADFREFFRAEGVADRFFEQYLQLFITGSPGQYRVRQVDGRGLPVSRNFLTQMGRIQTIRRSFFAENPAEPQVQFKLEPYLLDSSLGRANFRIGNQSLEYRHGPIVQSTFRWPMEAEDGRSSLILEDLGGRRLTLDQNSGAWSLFRLLDQLEVDHHHERDALILKANLSGLRANYLLHSQRSPNPFDLVQLRSFSLPARL